MGMWVRMSDIKNQPQVVKKGNTQDCTITWIPIIDGASCPMPKENRVYLVTYETMTGKRYVRDLHCNYSGISPRYIGWSKKINGTVIAWAELPEAYVTDRDF